MKENKSSAASKTKSITGLLNKISILATAAQIVLYRKLKKGQERDKGMYSVSGDMKTPSACRPSE